MNFVQRIQTYLSDNLQPIRRYLGVGIFLNGCSFILYVLLTIYLKLDPVLVVVFLSPTVVVIHFLLQVFYVFSKDRLKYIFVMKYLIKFFIIYFLNISLLYLFTKQLNLNHIISQFFILAGLASINFWVEKNIIFK